VRRGLSGGTAVPAISACDPEASPSQYAPMPSSQRRFPDARPAVPSPDTVHPQHEPVLGRPHAALRTRWAWGLAALTGVLCVALASDVAPILRGPVEWRWHLQSPLNLVPWRLVAPAAVAALAALWFSAAALAPRVGALRLVALAALALAFRFAVQFTGTHGVEVVGRTMNPAFYGYFAPATRVTGLRDYLRSYAAHRECLSFRERAHPPGNVVFFWTFLQAARHSTPIVKLAAPLIERRRPTLEAWASSYTDAEAVAAAAASLAVGALGCLAVVPLYLMALRLSGPRAALLAAGLFVFMPPGALFLPVVDDLQTFVAAAAAFLTVVGVARDRLDLVATAGLTVGVGTFLSYSMLPVAAFLVLLTVLSPRGVVNRRRGTLLDVGVLAAAAAAVWLVAWLWLGLEPVRLFLASMRGNFNVRERSYWTWLVGDPYDLLLFAGVPVAVHFTAGLVGAARRALRRGGPSSPDAVALAFALALGALFVSGALRGEAARTLLYAFPFMAWLAADHILGGRHPGRASGVAACALLAVQTVAFNAILHVYH